MVDLLFIFKRAESALHLNSMLAIFFYRLGERRSYKFHDLHSSRMTKRYKELVEAASQAKEFAHAPYSNFRVGAALLTTDDRIITGCNIENSSYGLTICAERTAIFKAYSDGIREFAALAIVSDDDEFTPPCGACRQVIIDLAGNIDIIMSNTKNKLKIIKIKSLLPLAFTSMNLNRIRQSRKD